MPKRIGPIKIQVTGRQEATGIRIKTLNPIGFYLSGTDEEAAKYWFLYVFPQWAVEMNLMPPSPGCFIGVADTLDWGKMLEQGEGLVYLEVNTLEETKEIKKTAAPEIIPNIPPMITDCWRGPANQLLWMTHEPGDHMDDWLVEQVKIDIKNGTRH